MKAANQLWGKIPTVADISQSLSIEFTDSMLQEHSNQIDLLNAPNQFLLTESTSIQSHSKYWHQQLNQSPGVIRIQVHSGYSDHELRLLYAIFSRSLGFLNNRYSYFFDVMDRGLDYTKEAIPVSKTKAETGYHTDSTAKHYYPDFIGLLCIQPALAGGESLLANAANLFAYLQHTFPQWNELMHTPLCRDVITPGTIQNSDAIRANDFPIFQMNSEGGIQFRYMRYWIESALEKLNEPSPEGLHDLLNTIDDYFADSANVMCFRLERGDMLFVNNRFLCHNRTAFMDGEKPRVYVRAWINLAEQE